MRSCRQNLVEVLYFGDIYVICYVIRVAIQFILVFWHLVPLPILMLYCYCVFVFSLEYLMCMDIILCYIIA